MLKPLQDIQVGRKYAHLSTTTGDFVLCRACRGEHGVILLSTKINPINQLPEFSPIEGQPATQDAYLLGESFIGVNLSDERIDIKAHTGNDFSIHRSEVNVPLTHTILCPVGGHHLVVASSDSTSVFNLHTGRKVAAFPFQFVPMQLAGGDRAISIASLPNDVGGTDICLIRSSEKSFELLQPGLGLFGQCDSCDLSGDVKKVLFSLRARNQRFLLVYDFPEFDLQFFHRYNEPREKRSKALYPACFLDEAGNYVAIGSGNNISIIHLPSGGRIADVASNHRQIIDIKTLGTFNSIVTLGDEGTLSLWSSFGSIAKRECFAKASQDIHTALDECYKPVSDQNPPWHSVFPFTSVRGWLLGQYLRNKS